MASVALLSGGSAAPVHIHTAPRLQLARGVSRRETERPSAHGPQVGGLINDYRLL